MKTLFARLGIARLAPDHLIALTLIFLGLPCLLPAQTLQHRYSFATDASDSVGGANGAIVPPNGGSAVTIANGLSLPGGGGGGFSGYVSLPGGILTTTTNLTIECWVTQNAANQWATVWDFANNTSENFALCPDPNRNNGQMMVAFSPNNNEDDLFSDVTFPNNSEQYVVLTVNASTLLADLYANAVSVGTLTLPNSSFIPGAIGGSGGTSVNALGNDIWGDPQLQGTIYELRIWNGVVSQRYLEASALLGSTVLVTNVTPTSITLTAGPAVVITGTEQATVTVELAQTGATSLAATGDVTNWTTSNPAILAVNSSGLITGVGVGTATVSGTVGGVTATSGNINVTPQALAHRYSFASDASDSVGGSAWNGTPVSGSGGSVVTINNGLSLPGNTHGGYGYSGYVSLPNGIVQGDTSVTVECWVMQNQPNTWAEIWDFGSSGSVNFGLIPASPTPNMRVGFTPNGGESDVDAPALTSGSEQYVVATYNNFTHTGSLYLNGALDASAVLPNTSYSPGSYGGASGTTEDMLGNDVFGDNQFDGTIYELRVWDGAVSPLYIALSQFAGPGAVATNLTPTSVTVTVTSTTMIGAQTQQATVAANFTVASNVVATSEATNWTSSNTNILTVSSSGLITAQSGGSATISATVNGTTGTSAPITVSLTSPVITQQPQPASETLVVGSSVSYTVAAVGGELTYQWFDGATAIPGATSSTLTLTNLTVGEAGNYSVLVTNALGSTNSAVASLTVDTSILTHRYSFVSDASDSIGHANGTPIAGNNPATINNGLMLPGTGTSGNPSGYVSLPGGIVDGDTSVTVECWVMQNQANTWAEIWSFGVAGGSVNFGLIPSSPTPNMRVAFTPSGGEIDINAPAALPSGSEQYVAVTYNNSNLTGSLYLNGSLYASTVFPSAAYSPGNFGNTSEDVLGLDPFGGDAQFNGTIYELRIWNGVVSPLYLAVSAVAGPGVVETSLTPTLVSVTETNATEIVGESEYAAVSANFTAAPGVVVTGVASNWISSSPSVLTVNSNGLITAVGSGSATISATVNGVTGTSAAVTVPTSAPIITAEPAAFASLLVGGTLNASVAVIGNTPLTYYWYLNSGPQPVSVSSAATLTMPNIQLTNAGSYTCLISNQYGTTNSTALVLTVVAPTSYQQALLDLSPLAYWPLDETDGTIAYDMAGSYNGTYIGGVTLAQSGPTNSFFGGASYAADFDGYSGYVDIPEGPFNITGAITIMAWVNLQADPLHFTDVIGHGDASWRVSVNQNSPPQPGASDGGNAGDATDSTGIAALTWHMLAYTYTGGVGNNVGVLYVDGAPVANSSTATPAGDNLDVWIGGAPDYGTGAANRLIPAEIAHCAIFTQALTAAEIQNVYNGALSPVNLTITASSPNVILTWPAGVLLQAPTVTGPWTTNSAALSPYAIPATSGNQFFKVLISQ